MDSANDNLISYYITQGDNFLPTLWGTCCLHFQDDWISFTWMVQCLSKTKSKSRYSCRSSLPVVRATALSHVPCLEIRC